jgi:DNA-binding CsgD family transcriptional regulator
MPVYFCIVNQSLVKAFYVQMDCHAPNRINQIMEARPGDGISVVSKHGGVKKLQLFEQKWRGNLIGQGWFRWAPEMLAEVPRTAANAVPRVTRTQEIEALIREGGRTFKEIGDLYGLTRERIRKVGKRIGITAVENRRTFPPTLAETNAKATAERVAERARKKQERADRIVALRKQRMTTTEIAAKLGMTQSSVSHILVAQGYRSKSPPGSHGQATFPMVRRLYRAGVPVKAKKTKKGSRTKTEASPKESGAATPGRRLSTRDTQCSPHDRPQASRAPSMGDRRQVGVSNRQGAFDAGTAVE